MTGPSVVLLAVALGIVVVRGPGLAQMPDAEPSGRSAEASAGAGDASGSFAPTRAWVQTHRQAIVSEAMDLDPGQIQAFWPLYREYRLAMGKLDDRLVSLLARHLEHDPERSDATAGQWLDESLGLEEARSQIRRAYVSRFRKVLADRQVARLFQVETRLDAVVNAEITERVPLVE